MQQKQNKSSILIALGNDRKLEQQEENKKIYLIKERIKREQLALLNKDKELRQIQEELQKQMTSQRRQLSQPINFSSIISHQQNYDSWKIIKDQERNNKKFSQPTIEFQKSNSYIQLLHEKKIEQKKLIEKRKEIKAKKYIQMKYSEIVREIYYRPITKSTHEEKSDNDGFQIKSKPISLHEKSYLNNSIESCDQILIDKYLVNKLEKILQINDQKNENHKNQPKKQFKIAKINNTSQKLSPLPKEKQKIKENSEGIHFHKKSQEFSPNQWKCIFDDSQISSAEKVTKTLDQIKLLKNEAEKLEVETETKVNIEKEEKLNDLLVNQIQARLALLEQFNQ